jgi:hypothetical protein
VYVCGKNTFALACDGELISFLLVCDGSGALIIVIEMRKIYSILPIQKMECICLQYFPNTSAFSAAMTTHLRKINSRLSKNLAGSVSSKHRADAIKLKYVTLMEKNSCVDIKAKNFIFPRGLYFHRVENGSFFSRNRSIGRSFKFTAPHCYSAERAIVRRQENDQRNVFCAHSKKSRHY